MWREARRTTGQSRSRHVLPKIMRRVCQQGDGTGGHRESKLGDNEGKLERGAACEGTIFGHIRVATPVSVRMPVVRVSDTPAREARHKWPAETLYHEQVIDAARRADYLCDQRSCQGIHGRSCWTVGSPP